MVAPDEDVILISSDGILIRIPVSDISEFARPSKGVRVMRVSEGEKIVTLSVTEHASEKEDEAAQPDENAENPAENTETEAADGQDA